MGKSIGEIYAELSLKTDKLHDGIKKSNREIAKLEQDIDKAVENINARLARIGMALSAGVTLPLTLLGKTALNTFTNFEQSMQNTFSVMSASGAEMEALRKKAEEMGATTRFSASQAADALYSLGSAGQSATQAMSSLDGVLKLAGATGSDLAFTSSTIASTLSQFNLQADKSSHIADVFALAISKSQANMTKLSYSMKYVGPVAAGLNVSLETSTAALMRLYNSGFGGEQAGTILRAGLQKLASGTDNLKSKLESLGLSYDEVNPKTNNLADIMDRLKEANVDVTKSSELFGEVAAAGMQKLIEGGGEAIRTMDGLLQASDGAAKKMQDIQNASFANTKAELASAFEAVQITLTSNVIPAVNIFAQGLTNALKLINELPVGVQTAGTAFAGLAAAAGPLLLVAVGVKKIKQEMVQLNMVAAANPIMAWGAAIAGVAAIAVGIIAQMKKAHEDYIHGAKRGLEEVRKLKDEALKVGNEGRSIKSLFDEYLSLKDKTSKTADEQQRYNNLLTQLQELVPGVTKVLDENGKALLSNEESVREAIRIKLKTEKELNEIALITAKSKALHAESVLASEGKKVPQLQADVEKTSAAMRKALEEYVEVQKIKARYDEAIARKQTDTAKSYLAQLRKKVGDKLSFNGTADIDINSASDIVRHFENYKKIAEDASKKASKSFEKTAEAIREQKEAQRELNAEMEKAAALNKSLENLNEKPQKKSYKEELKRLAEEWQAEKKTIDERKRYAVKMGEDFNVSAERVKYLQRELKKLIEIKPENIDKIFTLNSTELQKYFNIIAEEQKKLKKAGRVDSKTKKDNSYQAQIEELDRLYKDKIAKAKEYGKNKLNIEKEYEEKRLALIEGFIQKEAELNGNRDNALETETKKGSGITLADELNKTNLMNNAFAAFLQQQKELQGELEKTKKQIEQTTALIEAGNYSQTDGQEEQAKAYLQQLRKEANKLELELLKSKYSLNQIDDTLKNLDRSGKSDFKLRLIDIEEERKNAYKVIEEAKKNKQGKFKDAKTDKEVKEAEAEYQKAADNVAKKLKTALAAGIINSVMGIADTITNIIASAIEQGGMSGVDALKAAGGLTKQIGSLIPGIGGAVTGAIGGALGMIGTIAGAINSRIEKASQKAREEARKFNENVQRQLREDIQKSNELIGDTASKIAKLQAGKKLNANTIFDSQALDIEKKRIDGFLSKIKELKTEATYSYTAAGTYRKKKHWYDWNTTEYTYYYTAYANYNVAQVMEKYNEAMRRKDYEAAKKWKDFAQRAINKGLKDAGIDSNNADSISNYLGSLDSVLAQYVKTRDMKSFKEALKEQLYNALVNKAVMNTMSQRIGQVLDNIEKGSLTYEEGIKKIENIGEEAGKIFDDMNKRFGLTAEQAKKEWEQVGKSISQALTNALGDAAYNADWGSFKKSFAAEMKKAIIQAAIENAGIKKKVDAIIAGIMKDGKITGDEVTDTIGKLKDLFDNLEGNMAELSKITKSLEGGVNIKSKTSGSVIQQLSGADRDWFTEVFKEGFSKINQVIDLKESTIQHIAATQLIVNSLTYNSYNSNIYITANEQTDLRAVLTEIVQEALAG